MLTAPTDTPVTAPVLLTLAMLVSLLIHTPPMARAGVSVNVIVAPVHTDDAPVIPVRGKAVSTANDIYTAQP